jgi:hypothetical protein
MIPVSPMYGGMTRSTSATVACFPIASGGARQPRPAVEWHIFPFRDSTDANEQAFHRRTREPIVRAHARASPRPHDSAKFDSIPW